jgi:hypothetical protein
MDNGASSHMENNPSILSSSSPPPLNTSIIIGNGAPLSVHHFGSSLIPTWSSPLKLNNVLISPSLIKNLISVRALTRDNFVSVTFDPFGFSIYFRMGTILLRCDYTSELYPLHSSTNNSSSSQRSFLATHNTELWHARLGHPGHGHLHHILSSFDFTYCKSETHACSACRLGKHVRLPINDSVNASLFPFQSIHYDVWTSPVVSNSNFKFYLDVLDDFSHYT